MQFAKLFQNEIRVLQEKLIMSAKIRILWKIFQIISCFRKMRAIQLKGDCLNHLKNKFNYESTDFFFAFILFFLFVLNFYQFINLLDFFFFFFFYFFLVENLRFFFPLKLKLEIFIEKRKWYNFLLFFIVCQIGHKKPFCKIYLYKKDFIQCMFWFFEWSCDACWFQ